MNHQIKKLVAHPLISGSSIVFIGFFIANILNFVFNLSMVHFLSKEDYGILITLSSLFTLLGIFQQSFQSSFAKFAAVYAAQKSQSNMHRLTVLGFKVIFIFTLAIFLLFLIITPQIMDYLHIYTILLLILTYITICASIIFALPTGIIQGELRFYLLSFANIISPFLKVIFGLAFVLIGWRVAGAVFAITLASTLGTIIIFFYILREFRKRENAGVVSTKFKELYLYWQAFFVTSIGITLLSNTDIILVRHFFNADLTGQYAVLSLAGKSIFYFTAPLNFAFFPLIAYKKEKKESILGTLLLGIGIVTLISAAISFVYFVFPYFVIWIFTLGKSGYNGIAPYLGPFSLYILVFSIASILNSYFLSIGKTRIYIFTLLAGILQIALIYLFHSNLFEVISALFVVSLLLSLAFIVYYFRYGKD